MANWRCENENKENEFDYITIFFGLRNVENRTKAISEIYRVLKEDGVFYNAVLTKESLDKVFYTKNGFKKFEKNEYVEMGQQAGFRNISFKNLGKNYGLLVIYEK